MNDATEGEVLVGPAAQGLEPVCMGSSNARGLGGTDLGGTVVELGAAKLPRCGKLNRSLGGDRLGGVAMSIGEGGGWEEYGLLGMLRVCDGKSVLI